MDGLNRLEAMIGWRWPWNGPPGQPTAKDLGRVLKVRTSPRLVKNSVQEDRGRPEPDAETQLEWLEDKDWVRRSSAPTATGTGSSWKWGDSMLTTVVLSLAAFSLVSLPGLASSWPSRSRYGPVRHRRRRKVYSGTRERPARRRS